MPLGKDNLQKHFFLYLEKRILKTMYKHICSPFRLMETGKNCECSQGQEERYKASFAHIYSYRLLI